MFLDKHSHHLTAILTVVLTFALPVLADRADLTPGSSGCLNPAVDTRVRFIRRMIRVGICLLAVLFAQSEFEGLNKLATGVLASGAIVAAIVGFSARQTLPN